MSEQGVVVAGKVLVLFVSKQGVVVAGKVLVLSGFVSEQGVAVEGKFWSSLCQNRV